MDEARGREEGSARSSDDSGEIDESYDPIASAIPVDKLKNGWRAISSFMKVLRHSESPLTLSCTATG